jgi:hypothetical protein
LEKFIEYRAQTKKTSIDRYDFILEKLIDEKCDIFLGADQNFDYANIKQHKNTSELFEIFYTKSILPTITKPTRITHTSATIIDNIYVKCKNNFNIVAGIITYNISDHLPVFAFIGNKNKWSNKKPLILKCRSITDTSVHNISNKLYDTNWSSLSDMSVDQGYDLLMNTLTDALNQYAPEKEIQISKRCVIREPWVTSGLLKSSRTRDKLYKHCLNKGKDDLCNEKFTTYRNIYIIDSNELQKKLITRIYFKNTNMIYATHGM